MRIPSYTQFKQQAQQLANQYASVEDLRSHIEKNKKIINSSENPVLGQRIKSTNDYLSFLDSYRNSILMAQTRSSLIESNINGSINSINRVAELVKNAQNDTLNNTDRSNISKELQGILKTFSGFANARDAQGSYVFSGNSVTTEPFVEVNGVYKYLGSLESSSIEVANGSRIIYGECGQDVFGDILTGNGIFEINTGSAPNTGTAETTIGNVSDKTAYVEDTYTISFVMNSSNQLAYQVVGAKSGQVIPQPPATSPANAPQYNPAGQAISFNGVTFEIRGTPSLTDQFVVSPSKKQNALETVNQLVSLLNTPLSNDVDRANFHQKLTQFQACVSQIQAHISNHLSEIGYRSKEIASLEALNTEEINNQKKVLSGFQDADYYDLISQMSQQTTTLQLTHEIYKRLQDVFSQLLA